MTDLIILKDRALITIDGEDQRKFLQGLITNDINQATEKNLIYAAMLNFQGKFLYDFFIFASEKNAEKNAEKNGEKNSEQKLIIDCFAPRCDEILQKLNLYKLRSKVTIKKNEELVTAQLIMPFYNYLASENPALPQAEFFSLKKTIALIAEKKCAVLFIDPRSAGLGARIYIKKSALESLMQDLKNKDESLYHLCRIFNKIPESEYDLTCEKSFILEFGFDNFNAINYEKGCYIGQELTARTHYRGAIRKKTFHVKITSPTAKTLKVEKNSEITCGSKSAGLILSSVFYKSELHALALIKLFEGQNAVNFSDKFEFEDKKISIVN
jgi:folate-binding protein YgfZ